MEKTTNGTHSLQDGISVSTVAELIGAEVIGSSDKLIRSLCSLDEPTEYGLGFTKSHIHDEVRNAIETDKLVAIIVPETWKINVDDLRVVFLRVKNPLSAMSLLTEMFLAIARPQAGISNKADIHPSVKIGKNVHIGAFCSIAEGVTIHDNAVLHSHVVIYAGVVIGERSVVHAGAVIRENCILGKDNIIQNGVVVGADGFGYFLDDNKQLKAVPQVGKVVFADNVEIGANSCIDRATLGTTAIGTMSKVDNLVQVGHNTKVGKGSLLCGNVGIAGSCRIGNQVTIGGCVGIADHVVIVDGCRVGGKSGVTSSLLERGDYLGFPAIPAQTWRRQIKSVQFLPDLLRRFRKVEKKFVNEE